MRFIYKGEPQKIRIGKLNENFYWVTLKKGEVELPEEIGRVLNLKEVVISMEKKITTSQIGQTKVETKQFEYTPDDLFFKELTEIPGIGPKTAKDLVVWGTKEKLIEAIELKADLPFRDDVVEKLRRKYGK